MGVGSGKEIFSKAWFLLSRSLSVKECKTVNFN